MQSQIIKSCLEKRGAAWIWDGMISINVSAVFISGEGVISVLTITIHWWSLTEGIPELASMITKTIHVTWVDVGLGGKNGKIFQLSQYQQKYEEPWWCWPTF